MKTWMACLMMACVIGNAAAQTSTRGNSDNKQHPKCEGQHDCRDYRADQTKSSTGESTGKADASTSTKGNTNNGTASKGGKAAKAAAKAGKAGTAAGASGGVAAGVGIAAGVGAIAVSAAAGGGGHHGSDRPRPSSP